MKAISCRMPVKIAAFFLLSVSLAFCVLGGLGISLLAEAGYYDADPPSFYDSTFCETVTEEYANEVFNTLHGIFPDGHRRQQPVPNKTAEKSFLPAPISSLFCKTAAEIFYSQTTMTDSNTAATSAIIWIMTAFRIQSF